MSYKSIAKEIFSDALEASLPKNFVGKYCQLDGNVLSVCSDNYDLGEYKNIYVFGSGKAAFTMAEELEKLLKQKIYKGLVVAPEYRNGLERIELCVGGHPLPTQKSFDSTKKLLEMMRECDEDDLFIYLLSGGSSALIELPIEPISLEDMQETTGFMLHNALDIHEVNTVRKHLSQIKGGRLAQVCKAQGVVLVVSDIIDNDLYSIGSAPLYGDRTTYQDAKDILEKKDIFYSMPSSVQEVLEKGISSLIDETPTNEKENIKHYIIASNTLALDAAQKSAIAKGLKVEKVNEPMEGDVSLMVDKMIKHIDSSSHQCILFGGECTVNVDGDGQGGRNQHAVALMLQKIYTEKLDMTFLSASTDGIDGNSDAAGAVIDAQSYIESRELDKKIENFDSYNLFKGMNSLVMSGASGTNVIDIAILIKGE